MSLHAPQSTDRLLVSQREAARLLSISERTLFALRERGELACVRVGPRILYSVQDLPCAGVPRRADKGPA